MKRIVLLGLALSTFASTAHASPPDAAKTPEDVANLYFKAFIKTDLDSAKALNDYLRPAYDGKDAIDIAKLTALPQALVGGMRDATIDQKQDAEFDKNFEVLTTAVIAAIRRSDCRAESSKITPDADAPSVSIASVRYRCTVPAAGMEKLLSARKKMTSAILKTAAETLSATPADTPVTGEFKLHSVGSPPRWESDTPGEVLSTVLDGMGGG